MILTINPAWVEFYIRPPPIMMEHASTLRSNHITESVMHLLSVVQPGHFTPVIFCGLLLTAHTSVAQTPVRQIPPSTISLPAPDLVGHPIQDSTTDSATHAMSTPATMPMAGPVARPTYSFVRLVPPPHPTDDAGHCDTSLGRRLGTGFVVGAVLGLVSYSTLTALTPDGEMKKRRRKLAAPLIIGTGIIMAVREAQFPSRLSCP